MSVDNPFFIGSEFGWLLASPGNALTLLTMFAWLFLVVGWLKLSRSFLSIVVLFMVLTCTFPLGEWLLAPLENRFSANPALPISPTGIIVLGGAVNPVMSEAWGQTEIGEAAERVTTLLYMTNLYPDAQVIFTGGNGNTSEQNFKEADYVRFLFEELSFGEQAILFESESRNAEENVAHSQALVNPRPDQDWILITSAFHMPRAVGVFCQSNWPVIPYPVDHRSNRGNLLRLSLSFTTNLRLLEEAVNEWVSLIAYRISGRTDRLIAGDNNQCSIG